MDARIDLTPGFQRRRWERSYGAIPPGWRFLPLGALYEERRERSADRARYPLHSVTLEQGVTPRTERYGRDFLLRDRDRHAFLIVHPGDLVFNPMNLRFGAIACARVERPVLVSSYYHVLAPRAGSSDPEFMEALLRSRRMLALYERLATGSLLEKRRVALATLLRTCISVPPPGEQQRLGELLALWHRAMRQTDRLIALRQRLRRGLERLLLSGAARLGSSTRGEWPSARLAELGAFANGAGVTKADLREEGHAAVRYGELYTTHEVAIRRVHSFIDDDGCRRSRRIQRGDILFAGSGETREAIGRAAVFLAAEEAYAGGDTIVFTPARADPLYLAYALNSAAARRFLRAHAQGHTVVHVRAADLGRMPVPLPPPEEQRRIARCLAAADAGIHWAEARRRALQRELRGVSERVVTGVVRSVLSDGPPPAPDSGEASCPPAPVTDAARAHPHAPS